VKVATWNVNGIRAREAQFVEWVRRDCPDVVCIQELKATPEQLGETLTMLPEYWNYWHGGPKGYSGVSLHFRKASFATRPQFGHPDFDVECRVVQGKVGSTPERSEGAAANKVGSTPERSEGAAANKIASMPERSEGALVVASVYVPNGGKDYAAKLKFLEAMHAYIDGVHGAGETLILCGDLNVARTDADVHPKERKHGAIGQRDDERQLFERILARDLVDVARVFDPSNDRLFTWWPPWRGLRQKNQGWRIDYILASADRGLTPTECKVLAEVGTSDHAPVIATFA
jgi:exodeoxyribonuclease-3